MNTTTTNIALVILSVVILGFIAYLIYINRASDEMIGITIKSFLIPILAGAGLLFIEFMKPLDSENEKIHIGLVDDPKVMMSLSNNDNAKLTQGVMDFAVLLATVKNETPNAKLEYKEIPAFVQVLIINMMVQRYSTHWDSTLDSENWFFERGSSSIYPNDEAEADPKKVTLKELKSKFDYNQFLNKMDDNEFISLPKGSKVTLGSFPEDIIKIETKNIELSIKIVGKSSATLPHSAGTTADRFRNKLRLPLNESYRINFYGASIVYSYEPKRILRWSPETIRQVNWAKDFGQYLKDFISWEVFLEGSK